MSQTKGAARFGRPSATPPGAALSRRRSDRAVRAHWGIENSQHWVLDVVFDEDACRARLDNAAENFALLCRLALNLLNSEGTEHASLRVKRRVAGWNDSLMLRILTAGTP